MIYPLNYSLLFVFEAKITGHWYMKLLNDLSLDFKAV